LVCFLFCVHKKSLAIIAQTLYDKAFIFSDIIMNVEETAVIEEVLVERPIHHYAHLLPSIFLVGPMGAGKTTIGKLLAKHLKRPFLDADWYISEKAGADIPWIFAKEGESGFRERESHAMDELSAMPDIVLATGGGVVERECNREYLQRGLVIFLDASVDTQIHRTKKDKNRPLLKNDNPRAVLEMLYQRRAPLYKEVADITVATGRAYPKQMMNEILDILIAYAKDIESKSSVI